MRRLIVPITVFAAVGLVLSIIGLASRAARLRDRSPSPLAQDEALVGLAIPEFSLIDQDGRERTQAILDGQVTVLDFTFTNCPFACPQMNAAMIQLSHELDGTGVRFVSISVDPEHDTPARLKEHANSLSVDESRWTFLTGDAPVIEGIVRGALQSALGPDESQTVPLPRGGSMPNIVHPTRFFLIGPDRRVLGIYDYNLEDEMERLKARAKAAMAVTRERGK